MIVRKLLLSIIGVLLAIFENPIALSAADEPQVVGINSLGLTETILLPESEPESTTFETPSAPMAGMNTVAVAVENDVMPSPVVPVVENYTVTYQVGSASEYNNLAYNLSYSHVYKFRKMVYGHNSSNLLLSLVYKNEGDLIAVTENGVTNTYRIVWKREMLKVSANDLQDLRTGQIYAMKDISWALNTYDLALETCSGYGDTPYRWVLFANRV